MVKKCMLTILIFAMLLAGCATAKSTEYPIFEEAPVEVERMAVMDLPSSANAGYAEDSMIDMKQSSQPGEGAERMVIRNADLRIVVDDPAASMKTITELAEEMGGFVVASQLYKIQTEQGLEAPEATITVRVPAEGLNEALDQIKTLVKNPKTDILSENVSGQDVTKEYTDLSSQLTNLVNTEKQLQKIMEQAYTTEDVMLVYNRLVEVRSQIEIIKGQMKYYEESAAMSAITVNLVAKESIQPLTVAGWQPVGTARDAVQALINVLRFLTNALIYIIILVIPTLAVIAAPIVLVIWIIIRVRRNAKRRKVAKQAPPEA